MGAPEPIRPDHITSRFSCGKPALDDWLKSRALKSEGRSARTYVVCAGDEVVGYYCLATGSVRIEALPKKLRGDMPSAVPVLLIGRLAVASSHQGLRIGGGLLKDALLRSLQASTSVGCRAVLVHAIDDEAAAFYAGYGFIHFPEGERTFFMSMKAIAAAI
ncbi:MAG: GNAT family N-acetyltransferase [Devosia sp.]